VQHGGRLGDPALGLLLGELAGPQPEGDVVAHVQVREQRVALEDRVDRAAVGRQGGDVPPAQQHLAGVGQLQPGDDAQEGRLAAARGAQDGDELAASDCQGDAAQDFRAAEALADSLQPDLAGRQVVGCLDQGES